MFGRTRQNGTKNLIILNVTLFRLVVTSERKSFRNRPLRVDEIARVKFLCARNSSQVMKLK